MKAPTGLVTFLFTDIEGSTRLAQEFPDSLPASLGRHHAILRKAVESNNGFVFEIVGDAFCCAFEKAIDAVKAAADAQIALGKEKWNDAVIKVRMGIHSGNVEWNGKIYLGYITLARTTRVMSAAYGEQILISNDAYELTRDVSYERKILFRDLGERKLKDIIQPVRLFQLSAKGLREKFPPLKTLDARPNNLPVQLKSFIGREKEIKKLRLQLKDLNLLTLTGSGGSGKTRLAIQLAKDEIDNFTNGVWLIELASFQDPEMLNQELIKVLGVSEEPNRTAEDVLCAHLKDKEILLILDNCEHLVKECARVAEKLLNNCPELKIIATSREPLKCEGEHTHGVLSLDAPDPKEKLSPVKLARYEAVKLFIERAGSADENFKTSNDNIPVIAKICYTLEGIPLAIELAAARTRILSVEKIYERLNDRFSLLTEGRRTNLPRQQTLRALIDWSYDLLTEKEKILWGRLSVFAGGWKLEATEDICNDHLIESSEIFELLSSLCEKSIISFDKERDRFGMLETMRKYGEEKLNISGEAKIFKEKHFRYYCTHAEKADESLSKDSLDRLEEDHLNFQNSLSWSLENGMYEEGARLEISLVKFWLIRGYFSEGDRWSEMFLKEKNKFTIQTRSKFFHYAGKFKQHKGEPDQSRKLFEESLVLKKELNDKKGMSDTLNDIGNLLGSIGEVDSAQKYFERSLAIRRELKDQRGIAKSLRNLGANSVFKDDFKKAKLFLDESLMIFRELQNIPEISMCLFFLSQLSKNVGRYEEAKKFIEESMSSDYKQDSRLNISNSLNEYGTIMCDVGDFDAAKKLFEESLAIRYEQNYKTGIAASLLGLGYVAQFKKDYSLADKYYNESLSISTATQNKYLISYSLINLGFLEIIRKKIDKAKKYFDEALALSLELGNKMNIVLNILGLAEVFAKKGNVERSACLLGAVNSFVETSGCALERQESNSYKRTQKILKKKLSANEFDKLFAVGKKMTLDEAVSIVSC